MATKLCVTLNCNSGLPRLYLAPDTELWLKVVELTKPPLQEDELFAEINRMALWLVCWLPTVEPVAAIRENAIQGILEHLRRTTRVS